MVWRLRFHPVKQFFHSKARCSGQAGIYFSYFSVGLSFLRHSKNRIVPSKTQIVKIRRIMNNSMLSVRPLQASDLDALIQY